MKKLFSNLEEKNTFIFFIILFGVFIIAFDPSRKIDGLILGNSDKVKHILAFVVICYFFIENSIKLNLWLKVFLLIFIAFFIEYIQSLIGRESNILDFFASLLGIFLYFLLKYLFTILKGRNT